MSKPHLNAAGSDANKPTEPVTSFISYGNTIIRVTEHFRPTGKSLQDLLIDLTMAQMKRSQTG